MDHVLKLSTMRRKSQNTRVAELLRAKRKKRGLSLAKIAINLGITRQSLSQIETAQRGIPWDKENKFETVYGLDLEERRTFHSLLRDAEVTREESDFCQSIWRADARQVYVIGGKKIPFESQFVREKAVEFLKENADREIIFVYPSWYEDYRSRNITFSMSRWTRFQPNSETDLNQLYISLLSVLRDGETRFLEQIKFFKIDIVNRLDKDLVKEAYSFCHPCVADTIAVSEEGHVIGYHLFQSREYYSWTRYDDGDADRILSLINEVRDLLIEEHPRFSELEKSQKYE